MDMPPAGMETAEGGVFIVKAGRLFRVQISPSTNSRRDLVRSAIGGVVIGSALCAMRFRASVQADKNFPGINPQILAGVAMLLPRRARAEGKDSSVSDARTPVMDFASASVIG